MTENKEIELLRKLEKSVRADKIGCLCTTPAHYDEKGHWHNASFIFTQDILAELDGLRDSKKGT